MTRGLRNNNPGNIRNSRTVWQGEVVPSTDRDFKQFKSMAYGYRAMIKLLQNYSRLYGCHTLRTMINRWAPPSENDTKGYISTVSKLTGIDPDRRVNIDSGREMCSIVAAMSRVENGVPVVMADIEASWELL